MALTFAVLGVGGVGAYFGARLVAAGEDVTFIARGATLAALRERGVRIQSILGDFDVAPVKVTDDAASVGPVDVVIVGVKTWQIPEAAESLRALVGPGTVVLPMQNGLEAAELLIDVVGRAHVLGGSCKIISAIVEPGVIKHVGGRGSLDFGELDAGAPSARVMAIRAAFEAAGVPVETPDDIRTAIWEKALFVSSIGALGAVSRVPIGEIRAHPGTRGLVIAAMQEVADVAAARGIPMPEDVVAKNMAFIDTLPEGGTTSLQRDIMNGVPSELEAQLGAVVRLGRESGVATPVYEFCLNVCGPMEARARKA